MGLISKPYTFSAGATIVAAEHNSNFDTIYAEFNGSISNDNISASAAIASSKLAQITAAGKVNISALTATGQAEGDMFYASSAAAMTRLAKGTASQILSMNSGATAPEWVTQSATTAIAGSVVQIVTTSDGSKVSSTTAIPVDDTIPQNTEGVEYTALNTSITPTAIGNTIIVEAMVKLEPFISVNKYTVAALFKDSVANAVCAAAERSSQGEGYYSFTATGHHLFYTMTTTATDEITFKARFGASDTTNVDTNSSGDARIFGGVNLSWMKITEIKV